MPFIPPGFANVQVAGTNPAGRQWLMACGCDIAAWDPESLEEAATFYTTDDWVNDVLAQDYFVTTTRVLVGTSDPSAPLVYEQSSSAEGGGSEGAGPNCAILLSKRTNLGGRKGRGRNFFPGPQEAAVNGSGQIIGDLATNAAPITGFWGRLFTALQLGDPYLLHTESTPAPTLITSMSMSSVIATQRRRLRG